jgi:hypothetical protein
MSIKKNAHMAGINLIHPVTKAIQHHLTAMLWYRSFIISCIIFNKILIAF